MDCDMFKYDPIQLFTLSLAKLFQLVAKIRVIRIYYGKISMIQAAMPYYGYMLHIVISNNYKMDLLSREIILQPLTILLLLMTI